MEVATLYCSFQYQVLLIFLTEQINMWANWTKQVCLVSETGTLVLEQIYQKRVITRN